jgi:hypothetical protein
MWFSFFGLTSIFLVALSTITNPLAAIEERYPCCRCSGDDSVCFISVFRAPSIILTSPQCHDECAFWEPVSFFVVMDRDPDIFFTCAGCRVPYAQRGLLRLMTIIALRACNPKKIKFLKNYITCSHNFFCFQTIFIRPCSYLSVNCK